MPRTSSRPKIILADNDVEMLKKIAKSRTEPLRRIQRAKMILLNHEGIRDKEIMEQIGVDINTVRLCLSKCLSLGVNGALEDMPRSGAPTEIKQEEKAWIMFLACEKASNFGYAQETWTLTLLLKHIHNNARDKGYANLETLAKSKLWSILREADIKPHKVKYYLERRDPEFEAKMIQVLCVYKQVNVALESGDNEGTSGVVVISYDEKPGIQAIGNTVDDLRPKPFRHSSVGRDYEYIRHGTVSLLAGINLISGKITACVSETHKSADFINWLEALDQEYANAEKIRIVLDNHSAHVSKETKRYMETKPNRFELVFTPKHGSWLNVIEGFFSKVTRVFLRNLRVSSKEEMKSRLLKFIEEINDDPVIVHWKYKMDEIII